jgi:hypothetical protein
MDASNGYANAPVGSDLQINNIQVGDGYINVDDVYVVFRRALDPTLTNYYRFWSNGVLQAEPAPNLFRGQPMLPAEVISISQADLSAQAAAAANSTDTPALCVTASDLQTEPGKTAFVSILAQIKGKYPVRVLMFNLNVRPLDGSPALTQPLKFTPARGLGQPTLQSARGPANYAAAWMNTAVAGLWGTNEIGVLQVTIPTNAPAQAAYKIEFEHFSASPNGLALFPQQVQDGLLTLSNRLASSWHDGIPDAWRLRHFGAVSNPLSHALADADGDGMLNWAEFKAGTNPTDT